MKMITPLSREHKQKKLLFTGAFSISRASFYSSTFLAFDIAFMIEGFFE